MKKVYRISAVVVLVTFSANTLFADVGLDSIISQKTNSNTLAIYSKFQTDPGRVELTVAAQLESVVPKDAVKIDANELAGKLKQTKLVHPSGIQVFVHEARVVG